MKATLEIEIDISAPPTESTIAAIRDQLTGSEVLSAMAMTRFDLKKVPKLVSVKVDATPLSAAQFVTIMTSAHGFSVDAPHDSAWLVTNEGGEPGDEVLRVEWENDDQSFEAVFYPGDAFWIDEEGLVHAFDREENELVITLLAPTSAKPPEGVVTADANQS
jgi:hypothetical protein